MQISVSREACLAPPEIMWGHIDGPMISWACYVDWLTWRERLMLWAGLTDVERLAWKRWPGREAWFERIVFERENKA